MARKKVERKIAVIDFETDPFLFGRVPAPFIGELWDGVTSHVFVGDDCAEQLIAHLENDPEPMLIYAHNGGKFDFHFMHSALENPMLIIKNRIVKAMVGIHELRDSYAILPCPLKAYNKDEFDYRKLEKRVRHLHMPEIKKYLHSDCVYLYDLVSTFIGKYGPKMTVGGTAMTDIKKIYDIPSNGKKHDAIFRPFFIGGRVQCFKPGMHSGNFKYVDVNSMYPYVMAEFDHPYGTTYDLSSKMPDNFDKPFFIHFTGSNYNALPSRLESGELVFTKEYGEFRVCSHELQVALEYGLVEIDQVHECRIATETINFRQWVDRLYKEKAEFKAAGLKAEETCTKYVLNSGYGRFAIDPENFEEWRINRDPTAFTELEANGYEMKVDFDGVELWSKPAFVRDDQFCDVAIAASITSAARSVLLRGIQNAVDPIYCDTDSIMARDFKGDMDKYRLGAWDLEMEASNVAIAGKKMYLLFDRDEKGKVIKRKLSSKGGTLTPDEIIRLCAGEKVRYDNAAPSFSIRAPTRFVSREFKQTA